MAWIGAMRSEAAITRTQFKSAAANRILAIERELDSFSRLFHASRSHIVSHPNASQPALDQFLNSMRGSHGLRFSADFRAGANQFRIDPLNLVWPPPYAKGEETPLIFPCQGESPTPANNSTKHCLALQSTLSASASSPIATYTLVVEVPALVEEGMSYLKPHGVDVEIFAGGQQAYRHLSRMRKVYKPGLLEPLRGSPESVEENWTYAGQNWTIRCTSVPGYLSAAATWQPWGVLFAGLLLSALLARWAHSLVRYSIQIEETVALRTRELQKARDEAVAASLLKSRFLANVSHEIRTPLNGVLGMSEFLLETPLNSEQREYTKTIQQSGELLLRLINDLLDLSKIEAGHLVLISEPVDLNEVLQGVVDLLSELSFRKGLPILTEVAPGLPRRILGDGMRIRQVLLNLMSNAVKFTDHGSVSLSISPGEGHQLCFQIKDTGPGIPPAIQDRLFQRFVMGDDSNGRRFGGTGLGLAISRELVERMGGRIWVESEAGKGTSFWFTLPATRLPAIRSTLATTGVVDSASDDLQIQTPLRFRGGSWEPHATPAPAPNSLPARGARILLVEDNYVNQRVTLAMLKKLGHEADVVSNGREAVAAFLATTYQLIFMDCQMPEMDGFEATAAIRQLEAPGTRTPIIALTANAMAEDRLRCLEAQMDDHISKPLHLHILDGALQKWAPREALKP